MKQAKVLTPEELKRLLKIVTFTRHKDRNRLIVLFSFLAGLRACELAQLRVKDVMSVQADIVEIKDTIYLQNWQTKGSSGSTGRRQRAVTEGNSVVYRKASVLAGGH